MKRSYTMLCATFTTMLLAGCQTTHEPIEQRINIETYTAHAYEKTTNTTKAKEAIMLLHNIDWQNARIGKARPADYKIQFSNSLTAAKTPVYELWLSPRKDKIEIIVPSTNQYAQLDRKTSKQLFKTIMQHDLAAIQ